MQNDTTNIEALKEIINQQDIHIRQLSTLLNNANIIISLSAKAIIHAMGVTQNAE